MRLMHLGALCLLSACASNQSLSDRLAGDRVRGDAVGVEVAAPSVADAFALAVGHCGHFHLSAQYDRPAAEGRYRFRCVTP
jgi:hypothetical protein